MSGSKPGAKFDIIVWGASGFVGKLICEYLVAQYGCGRGVRWAMGGRSQSKLEAVRDGLGSVASDVPIITGDAADPQALAKIVKQTKVIITTVGPYAIYGSDLVAACAEHGVDYVDLAGEAQWIRRMIDAHQDTAEKSGARIVPSCGFDSVPSDLGVYFLNAQVKKQTNAPCTNVKMRVKSMKGGASGGTVASMINMMEEAGRDPEVGKVMADPYALAPEGLREGPKQPSDAPVEYDEDAHSWIAPFVMAGINTRVVHRTNALLDYAYSQKFRYGEAMMMGEGIQGRLSTYGLAAGLGGFMAAASLSPTRSFLSRFVLPKPGEGPDKDARENGFYNLVFLGKTEDDQEFVARVTGDKDPGYGSTAKIITECALCLAKDITSEQTGGGIWTPAAAMGDQLLDRLVENAGLTFEMEDVSESY
jgi:short subunit dehydrogenase-like uncharacterized protein